MKDRMLRKAMMAMAMVMGFGIPFASPAWAEFEVYDAKNQYLGVLATDIALAYTIGTLQVFVPSLNQVVRILRDGNVLDERIIDRGQIGFFYETEDCSGTPYQTTYYFQSGSDQGILPDNISSGLFNYPRNYYIRFCDKIYFVDNKPKTFAPKSQKWFSCGSPDSSCQKIIDDYAVNFYPLTEVYLIPQLLLPFTTPVALPLQFKQTTFDVNGDRRRGLAEGIFILQDTAGAR